MEVSLYILFSWIMCLATSCSLLFIVLKQRFLFIKPSIAVGALFHVCIQWSATLEAGRIESYLPSPWAFGLMTQAFPLVGIVVSIFTFRRGSREVWNRCTDKAKNLPRGQGAAILVLILMLMTVMAFYFSAISPSETGLYAILFSPEDASLARDRSLKGIEISWLRYTYSFAVSSFAPLLGALVWLRLMDTGNMSRLIRAVWAIPVLGILLVVVSISGARGFAAIIILVFGVTWAIRRGIPLNPVYLVLIGVIGLAVPVCLTVIREGGSLSWEKFCQYLVGPLAERVFYMPMETGLYYTHYVQTHDFLGAQAVERLALIMDIPYFNAPHELGLLYYPQWASEMLFMNTCYVFAYYADFGLITLPFCLLGLWFLDFSVPVYRRLSNRLLLPCCATISVASISLISVEYTVTLLSKGILVTLLTAMVIDRLTRPKNSHAKSKSSDLPTHLGSCPS